MATQRHRRAAWLATATLAVVACATYSEKTQLARDDAQTGDLAGSEKVLNRFLGTKDSADLPAEWKKETIVALLERAMVLHAKGQWKLSARDLVAADKQLVLLDIARDPGEVGKWIFSDSSAKYHAPPSEKLALNAFNMLNYILAGDLSGARVEAKRFTITRGGGRRGKEEASPPAPVPVGRGGGEGGKGEGVRGVAPSEAPPLRTGEGAGGHRR